MLRTLFAFALLVGGLAAQVPTATPSRADGSIWVFPGVHMAAAPHILKRTHPPDPVTYGWTETKGMLLRPGEGKSSADDIDAAPDPQAAGPVIGKTLTVKLSNFGGVPNEKGEPSIGGIMNKTLWAAIQEPAAGRVVVHTFASEINTALAAYRGTPFASNFIRVALNDDKGGPFGTQSLIQFNYAAATRYLVQIGSKTGDEDDIYLTATFFPPEGGLSAFLATTGSRAFNRDFVCIAPNSCIPSNENPTFILHNSTNKTMIVEGSSNLGAGIAAPAPLTLAPGQVKQATFTFTNAFNTTTARTVSGYFTFTGKVNGQPVSVARHRALIVVETNSGTPDVLKVSVDAEVRATVLGEDSVFQLDVTNRGTVAARGCHARGFFGEALTVAWRQVNRSTNAFIGAINAPFDIPAGGVKTIRVGVWPQTPYFADPRFNSPIDIDCNNTPKALQDQGNHFSITTLLRPPADQLVQAVAPKNGILNVPASGTGSFLVLTKNVGATTRVTARPSYDRPFDDPPNTIFTAKVCESDAQGVCLGAQADRISFSAVKNQVKYFKVVVRPPSGKPVFDPAQRRIFLLFEQNQSSGSTIQAIVGSESVAVKKT